MFSYNLRHQLVIYKNFKINKSNKKIQFLKLIANKKQMKIK